jgi:hypothetical protein
MWGKGIILLVASALLLGTSNPEVARLTKELPGLPEARATPYAVGEIVAAAPTVALWNAAVSVMAAEADDAPKQAPDDPVVAQFEQEFGPQFRQLYRSELHFMRLVCQPTREQYERILAESATENTTVRRLAALIRDRQEGRVMVGAQQFEVQDLRKLITDRLAKSLRPTLSADQAARYQKELEQRAESRKRAALLILLARLDQKLALTAGQRATLGEILEKNWNDSWGHMQWLMHEAQHFPPLPDDKILPVLTETQKNSWRAAPKANLHFGFNLEFVPGIEIEEEVWPDEPKKGLDQSDGKAAIKDSPRD